MSAIWRRTTLKSAPSLSATCRSWAAQAGLEQRPRLLQALAQVEEWCPVLLVAILWATALVDLLILAPMVLATPSAIPSALASVVPTQGQMPWPLAAILLVWV